ncbi:MAG TPA: FtsK/SpoIIIE domain-containing protein [Pedococcus sp.]
MRLRLTVTVPPSGGGALPTLHELEVDAPSGSTSDDLLEVLCAHLGTRGRRLRCGLATLAPGALVGQAPLVDGACLTLSAEAGAPGHTSCAPRDRTPVSLVVSHGPDAGHRVGLLAGRRTVGRSGEADLSLDDPSLSRLHAALDTGPDGTLVVDLGSTNGTVVGSEGVGRSPVTLAAGTQVAVGDSRLELRITGAVPAASTPRPDGTRAVNRRPRPDRPALPPAIALPEPPEKPLPARIPWVAMLVPVPVAAVLALFLGPSMLAFALMSPLLLAGTALGDRLGSRREYAARLREHARLLGAALGRVESACIQERRERRLLLPDPAELLDIASGPTARLWERRRDDADALVVSLGTCTTAARVRVVRPRGDDGAEHPPVPDVPCAVALGEVGVLGVCGPRTAVLGAVTHLVGQLAVLHSPLDLELVAVVNDAAAGRDWEWLGRLPHTRRPDGTSIPDAAAIRELEPEGARRAVARLVDRVRERSSATRTAGMPARWPRTVLLVDGAAGLRGTADLAEVLEAGPAVGVCCIALDSVPTQLPSESAAVLDLSRPGDPQLSGTSTSVEELVVDGVGAWWADRLSRALAPLRDATPLNGPAELPSAVSLREVCTVDVTDPAAVARLWDSQPRASRVPVGRAAAGPHCIDLATDGPHILLGGTTGSGKSELLRSFVVALAAHNRPEHLSLVLVDYKGGAAFRECAELPHSAGVVTDLDDRLAARALTSLRAELRRRERVLAAAGVTDHTAYLHSPSARDAPLPRLVVVIDELRALTEELPAFVDGMVRIAALGRSLGVHVVMATQRPAGVVTGDIRANLNLRIALRVRDRADSDDVIDAPDAAAIDPTVPGRALARTGDGRLVAFQAAHAGAPFRRAGDPRPRVRAVRWGRPGAAWPDHAAPEETTTELARVVHAVREAVAATGALPAAPAWQPPLPAVLEPADPGTVAEPYRAVIGLADRPDRQAREALCVDLLRPGVWGFAGTAGSGRTTALLSVARSFAAQLDSSRLHIYAVSGGSLASVADLPHCGAHVDHDDLVRLDRLVARLRDEVAARRRGSTASGARTAAAPGGPTPTAAPAILVLVDDWDLLTQRADTVEHARLADRLLALLREGEAVGLRSVVAGDRALLVGRVASAVEHRVVLRLADRADAALAGLAPGALPVTPPPGRGVLADGTEVQLALPPPVTPPTGGHPGRGPLRVEPLPSEVPAGLLPEASAHDGDAVAVGLGGDELAVLSLDPEQDGRRWLVTGPVGSGVSTALARIASELLARGRALALVSSRPGTLDRLRLDPRLVLWCDDPFGAPALARVYDQRPDLAVVVDDADQLLDTPLEPVLTEVARSVDRHGGLLVCGADSTALALQYRGPAVEVARHRTGLLLGPGAIGEADLFGVRVRTDRSAPAGRGHLVRRGRAVPLQVALPADGGSGRPASAA